MKAQTASIMRRTESYPVAGPNDVRLVAMDPLNRKRARLDWTLQQEYEIVASLRRAELSGLAPERQLTREEGVQRIATLVQVCEARAKALKGIYLSFSEDIAKEFGSGALPTRLRTHANSVIGWLWNAYGLPIIAKCPPPSRVRLSREFGHERGEMLKAICLPVEVDYFACRQGFSRGFDHSVDFSWVLVRGARYSLGKGRSFILNALHSDWRRGGSGVKQDALLSAAARAVGLRSIKMQHVWKGFVEFGPGKLIRQTATATWAMCPPSPCRCISALDS